MLKIMKDSSSTSSEMGFNKYLHSSSKKEEIIKLFTILGYDINNKELSIDSFEIPVSKFNFIIEFSLLCEFDLIRILYLKLDKPANEFETNIIQQISKFYPYTIIFLTYFDVNTVSYLIHPVQIQKAIQLQRYIIDTIPHARNRIEQLCLLEIYHDDNFNSVLMRIQSAFSVDELTTKFFKDFKQTYKLIQSDLATDLSLKEQPGSILSRISLQILNRLIFLYFIQKRDWFDNNGNYLQVLFAKHKANGTKNSNFYQDYLLPIFFLGLGGLIKQKNNELKHVNSKFNSYISSILNRLTPDISKVIQLFPKVGGNLFEVNDLDLHNYILSDNIVEIVIDNLFEKYDFIMKGDDIYDICIGVNLDMLGDIYESLISEDERGQAGIFYTPRVKVLFINQLAVYQNLKEQTSIPLSLLQVLIFDPARISTLQIKNNDRLTLIDTIENLRIIDPACGSGAFLVSMAQLLVNILTLLDPIRPRIQLKYLILQNILFGVDVKQWALQMTQLRLWLWFLSDYTNGDNKDMQLDYFDLSRHESDIQPVLPLLNLNLQVGDVLLSEVIEKQQMLNITSPTQFNWRNKFVDVFRLKGGFDIVVGNPPYIRSEEIYPPYLDINQLTYIQKRKLNSLYKEQLKQQMQRIHSEYSHNEKQDYMVYFIYLGIYLLNQSGVLSFIISDSWMNMSNGFELQKFLTKNTKIINFITNISQRTFDAQVNTCIMTLVHSTKDNDRNLTKFISFKGSNIDSEYDPKLYIKLLNLNQDYSTDTYSVRIRTQAEIHNSYGFELLEKTNEIQFKKFNGNKWGNLLFRTPDYFINLRQTLLDRCSDQIIEMKMIPGLEIIYGNKTGFTNFFFPTQDLIKQFRLPSNYLQPCIKSPKGFHFLSTSKLNKLANGNQILVIPQTSNLPVELHQYIKMAETNRKFNNNNPPQFRPSLNWGLNIPWYCIPLKNNPPRMMVGRFTYDMYRGYYNDDFTLASDAFYLLDIPDKTTIEIKAVCAILNSYFVGINSELLGRIEGGGVLQVLKWELERFYIYNINSFNDYQIQVLANLFDKLNTVSVINEFSKYKTIKQDIDDTILKFLGYSDHSLIASQLKEFYEILVNYRIVSGRGS